MLISCSENIAPASKNSFLGLPNGCVWQFPRLAKIALSWFLKFYSFVLETVAGTVSAKYIGKMNMNTAGVYDIDLGKQVNEIVLE